MGIPKFYRWLSERYPLLNQKVTATEGPPEIDNLYLDMNGIIHNCTHANRTDVKNDEQAMMLKVFTYLEKLIQIIKPQKVLFMAIDGVAPRAKMNQQRSRRFKSAEERKQLEAEKRRKGEEVSDDPFDSNCITPGTAFMARLGSHLRFFIRRKIAEDPLWQTPTIVFSGHEIPGEGEHKIMEYIRWEKQSPTYEPNLRHCLYGLDADLIMLALVTHEPHFCLLREVVSYTGGGRGQPARETLENPCAENFVLFQIGLLREYFHDEFSALELPFALDVERVVDDFVLFCMLIGNDFLPALPTLDINEGALNHLFTIYKELLPQMCGYITCAGQLDRKRFEVLLSRMGKLEQEVLEERAKDAEFMENKRAKRDRGSGGVGGGYGTGVPASGGGRGSYNQSQGPSGSGFSNSGGRGGGGRGSASNSRGGLPGSSSGSGSNQNRFAAMSLDESPSPPSVVLLQRLEMALEEEAVAATAAVVVGPTMMSREARDMLMSGNGSAGLEMWKDRLYTEKLGVPAGSISGRRDVVEHYLTGLHWVLEYYYRGVASWDWYYQHHYAPMASDLVQLDEITVVFSQGSPFRPFQQLLAVLPSASSQLLPAPFQPLMLNPDSPILDFYPLVFDVDMEGKRAEWEGVVKVPFVDEARLLLASASVRVELLSAEERARNEPGCILEYSFTPGTPSMDGEFCSSTMPAVFSDLRGPCSQVIKRQPLAPLPDGILGFEPFLVAGTSTGLTCPLGFPTIRTLTVKASLRMAGVNVLGMPSRKESVVLALKDLRSGGGGATITAAMVAPSLLGARCYVSWPYLQEAMVVSVSDKSTLLLQGTPGGGPRTVVHNAAEASKWECEASILGNSFVTRYGVDVGKVDIVVTVRVVTGFVRHLDGSVQKQYAADEVLCPLQVIIRKKPQLAGAVVASETAEGFPSVDLREGMSALFLGQAYYGCVVTILSDLGGQPISNKKAGAASGSTGSLYRVRVQPVNPELGDDALRTAKRLVRSHEPRYMYSGAVARQLGVSPRSLGRITGNLWLKDGDDRYDIGVAVKSSKGPLCVPGFSIPSEDGGGWQYSNALALVLRDYKSAHGWVWDALEKSGESHDLYLDSIFPNDTPELRKSKMFAVIAWIKSSPLAKKPLVKTTVTLLCDEGVRALQTTLAPIPSRPLPCVEFEAVSHTLLVPPFTPGPLNVKMAVQGGIFVLGDRVVSVGAGAGPPFGMRGTVIGVYDEALEIIFDADFPGGSTLSGRALSARGAHLEKDCVVNVSSAVNIPLPQQPRQVPSSSAVTGAKFAAVTLGGGDTVAAAKSAGMAALARAAAVQPLSAHAAAISESTDPIPRPQQPLKQEKRVSPPQQGSTPLKRPDSGPSAISVPPAGLPSHTLAAVSDALKGASITAAGAVAVAPGARVGVPAYLDSNSAAPPPPSSRLMQKARESAAAKAAAAALSASSAVAAAVPDPPLTNQQQVKHAQEVQKVQPHAATPAHTQVAPAAPSQKAPPAQQQQQQQPALAKQAAPTKQAAKIKAPKQAAAQKGVGSTVDPTPEPTVTIPSQDPPSASLILSPTTAAAVAAVAVAAASAAASVASSSAISKPGPMDMLSKLKSMVPSARMGNAEVTPTTAASALDTLASDVAASTPSVTAGEAPQAQQQDGLSSTDPASVTAKRQTPNSTGSQSAKKPRTSSCSDTAVSAPSSSSQTAESSLAPTAAAASKLAVPRSLTEAATENDEGEEIVLRVHLASNIIPPAALGAAAVVNSLGQSLSDVPSTIPDVAKQSLVLQFGSFGMGAAGALPHKGSNALLMDDSQAAEMEVGEDVDTSSSVPELQFSSEELRAAAYMARQGAAPAGTKPSDPAMEGLAHLVQDVSTEKVAAAAPVGSTSAAVVGGGSSSSPGSPVKAGGGLMGSLKALFQGKKSSKALDKPIPIQTTTTASASISSLPAPPAPSSTTSAVANTLEEHSPAVVSASAGAAAAAAGVESDGVAGPESVTDVLAHDAVISAEAKHGLAGATDSDEVVVVSPDESIKPMAGSSATAPLAAPALPEVSAAASSADTWRNLGIAGGSGKGQRVPSAAAKGPLAGAALASSAGGRGKAGAGGGAHSGEAGGGVSSPAKPHASATPKDRDSAGLTTPGRKTRQSLNLDQPTVAPPPAAHCSVIPGGTGFTFGRGKSLAPGQAQAHTAPGVSAAPPAPGSTLDIAHPPASAKTVLHTKAAVAAALSTTVSSAGAGHASLAFPGLATHTAPPADLSTNATTATTSPAASSAGALSGRHLLGLLQQKAPVPAAATPPKLPAPVRAAQTASVATAPQAKAAPVQQQQQQRKVAAPPTVLQGSVPASVVLPSAATVAAPSPIPNPVVAANVGRAAGLSFLKQLKTGSIALPGGAAPAAAAAAGPPVVTAIATPLEPSPPRVPATQIVMETQQPTMVAPMVVKQMQTPQPPMRMQSGPPPQQQQPGPPQNQPNMQPPQHQHQGPLTMFQQELQQQHPRQQIQHPQNQQQHFQNPQFQMMGPPAMPQRRSPPGFAGGPPPGFNPQQQAMGAAPGPHFMQPPPPSSGPPPGYPQQRVGPPMQAPNMPPPNAQSGPPPPTPDLNLLQPPPGFLAQQQHVQQQMQQLHAQQMQLQAQAAQMHAMQAQAQQMHAQHMHGQQAAQQRQLQQLQQPAQMNISPQTQQLGHLQPSVGPGQQQVQPGQQNPLFFGFPGQAPGLGFPFGQGQQQPQQNQQQQFTPFGSTGPHAVSSPPPPVTQSPFTQQQQQQQQQVQPTPVAPSLPPQPKTLGFAGVMAKLKQMQMPPKQAQ